MQIKRFAQVIGETPEEISGQSRTAFSMDESEDFYDMIEWMKHGGYKGSVIRFYDYETGKVFCPFEKKRNVLYGRPVYSEEFFYFLQGDFNENKIRLYQYSLGETPKEITALKTDEVELYNLMLLGNGIHIISQDDMFRCYYPVQISFPIEAQESVILIDDENRKVYVEAWVEEGWDEEKDRPSEDYKYYEKVIVKDFSGNILSEEVASLNQAPDGTWWIS